VHDFSRIRRRKYHGRAKRVYDELQPWTLAFPKLISLRFLQIEDAVLRMLMDKYKPLRVPGTVRKIQQPSDEPLKLTEAPAAPRVMTASGQVDQTVAGYRWQEGDPPRFPWEHTFKSPADKDGKPLVKTGVLVRATTPPRSTSSLSHNKGARPSAGDIAARVFRAKDASIDYASGSTDVAKAKAALGMKGRGNDHGLKAKASGGSYRPMPTSITAWNSLVDEKIELARQQGLFKTVKGRGKPLVRDDHDSNVSCDPFRFSRLSD
jgi:hypothetical protein